MPDHPKHASPAHPIHDVHVQRFSPYVYEPRSVEREKLLSCLEAARWAPSSFNEQPWTFFVAERENSEEFAKMLDCLLEANQSWAKNAGVLLLTVAAETFSRNNKPNRVCDHDVGLAVANLTMQATELGLHAHQMAGINLSKSAFPRPITRSRRWPWVMRGIPTRRKTSNTPSVTGPRAAASRWTTSSSAASGRMRGSDPLSRPAVPARRGSCES